MDLVLRSIKPEKKKKKKDEEGKLAEDIAASKGFFDIVELISQKRMELLSLNQDTSSNNSLENQDDCKIWLEPESNTK